MFRKDFGDPVKNEKDFGDWNCHQIEYHWQSIIRSQYLHNFYPVRVYDLALSLRRDHLLAWDSINSILQHLIRNNSFVDVDRLNQDNERKFHLRRFPRFGENIQVPYSLLPMTYYENMCKVKGIVVYDTTIDKLRITLIN